MRRLLLLLLLSLAATAAHARYFERAELEALLAPVALYPDALLGHVLVASHYPDQVVEAARGAPPAPHWHPSVAALTAYPDLLARMSADLQWLHELATAHAYQGAELAAVVQGLRTRPPAVVYVPRYVPVPVWIPHHGFHRHHHGHAPRVVPYRRVPEAERRPIVHSTPQIFNKPETRPGIHQKPRTFGHR